MSRASWMKPVSLATAAIVMGAVAHLGHLELREARAGFPADEDVLYLPPPGQLRAMSLGYNEALADLVWVRAVIFAGDRIGGQNFAWITRYLDGIVLLAPTFRRPYDWGGVTAIYNGRAIDREMVDSSVTLYRLGLERFPEDHEFLFNLGMILFRDVPTVPGFSEAERVAAREEGAD